MIERAEPRALGRWPGFVGVLMTKRPEFLEANFGATRTRTVPYSINFRHGPD
jgi:hypothetical protein